MGTTFQPFTSVPAGVLQVDLLRVALVHRPTFAPHKAFATLDPLGNGFLTSKLDPEF